MKHWTRIPVGFLAASLIFAFAGKAVAQEKAKADKPTATPAQEKIAQPGPVLFENERVRVTETRIKPGERNEMNLRGDRVNVYITAAKQRVHYGDGSRRL